MWSPKKIKRASVRTSHGTRGGWEGGPKTTYAVRVASADCAAAGTARGLTSGIRTTALVEVEEPSARLTVRSTVIVMAGPDMVVVARQQLGALTILTAGCPECSKPARKVSLRRPAMHRPVAPLLFRGTAYGGVPPTTSLAQIKKRGSVPRLHAWCTVQCALRFVARWLGQQRAADSVAGGVGAWGWWGQHGPPRLLFCF